MNDRMTISTYQLMQMYPDADSARAYFEAMRWGPDNHDIACPHCGGTDRISARNGNRAGYYRCGDCKGPEFTVRTGTIFERSHVPLNKWLLAMYIVVTARKGISSLQLSKEIGVTQKTAWFMLGRLREACGGDPGGKLAGIVEADEAFIGGKEGNKHADKKLNAGRGTVGKTPVLGLRERGGRSIAMPVGKVDKATIHAKIAEHVEPGSQLHTDEASAYDNLPGYIRSHVKHGAGEYVKYVGASSIHVNSAESMWAVLKRGIYGTWHHVSIEHLARYVNEATFRLNEGNVKIHTLDRLAAFAKLAFGKRITYKQLMA